MSIPNKTSQVLAANLPTQVPPFPKAPSRLLSIPGVQEWSAEQSRWWNIARRQLSFESNGTNQRISRTNNSVASLTQEIQLVTTSTSALASRVVTLESQVQTPTTGLLSRVQTIENTYVDFTTFTALANRTTTLESQVQTPTTGLLARVQTIENTYVDASGAYAQAVSAITAELTGPGGSIFASVKVVADAIAQTDGFLESRYMVNAIAGDIVTGMTIYSASGPNTEISEVKFQANVFQIWNGTAGVPIFDLSGSTIRLNASVVVLGNITLGQVTGAGALAAKNTADITTDVTGAGALATKNSVDLATGDVTNKSLANVDSAANSKLAGIEAGATAGAAWGTNLTGRPVELTDGRVATALNAGGTVVSRVVPASAASAVGAGLYLGSDFLGFFNGTAWRSYMDNAGQFFLAGAGGNALAWDGSTLTIAGTLDVGTGINRAFVGEVSPGSYTIRRGIAGSNRIEMASVTGGPTDYSQFRAFNSANALVGLLGTDAINGQGLLQLATSAGVSTVFLDGSSGRAEVAESFRGPLGSAGSLPFTFTGRTGDGIYSAADGAVGIACGGVNTAFFQRSSNDFFLEIGQGRTADGFCYIDLRGDMTHTDYGLRLLRGNGGANTNSTIAHRGTGALQLVAEANAEIQLWTNGVQRFMVNDVGGYFHGLGDFGGNVTANGDLIMTGSRAIYNNGVMVVKTRQAAVTRPTSIGTPSSLSGSDWSTEYATVNSNFTAVQNSLNNLRDRINDLIDRLQDSTGHGLLADSP